MRPRLRLAALFVALVLTVSGLAALGLAPGTANAEPMPPEKADFTIAPGDTKTESFDKALVGSAEVKGNPDTCRHDQVTSLTCDAKRIKLTRAPGYTLTVVLEWTAYGVPNAAQVPDVDLYIFDGATSSLDSSQVGGAGQTTPEQAKFVPTQDEYDVVAQAYAGAIQGYKLTFYYSNASAKQAAVTPDIVLTPKEAPFVKTYSTALTGETGSPVFYPLVHFLPDSCRNDPAYNTLCDVYRLKLNRNKTKGALNFVVIQLDWQATELPDVDAVAAGLGLGYVPGLVMFLWDAPDHAMDRGAVGGQDDVLPTRLGFTATQDEYDVVVQVSKGVATSYKLTAYLSDEVFQKPFEVLDPLTGLPAAAPPDNTGIGTTLPDNSVEVPPLALAPIDTDSQIAGIGLGTTEQFDATNPLLSGHALRATAITGKAPSGLILVLMLVLLPLGAMGGGVYVLRRRHSEIF